MIVLNDLFQRGIAVKVLEGIWAGELTERSLVLDLALVLSEDQCRDIVRKTKNGLEAARRRGRVGGLRPVVDGNKRAAILARHWPTRLLLTAPWRDSYCGWWFCRKGPLRCRTVP